MNFLFETITAAMTQSPFIALTASLVWGILSILLSPCHLSSIPLIIGIITAEKESSKKHAFFISLIFALGILVTIAAIGVITSLAGMLMGDIGGWGTFLAAAVLFFTGLLLLDVIHIPTFLSLDRKMAQKAEPFAVFLLGLIFGLALGPCTFAFMAPVLGVVFGTSSNNLLLSGMIILFFALGHCGIIVFAGTFMAAVKNYLKWHDKTAGITWVRKISGTLIILGGLTLLYDRFFSRFV